MGEISVGPAISAGFRLIGREPLAFLAWCAGYFAISAVILVAAWPETSAYYEALAAGADVTDAAIQPPFGLWQWLSVLVTLVVAVCLPAAAMRAVLRPDDRGIFFLRLGSRELWLALCLLVLTILWIVAYLVGVLGLGLTIGAVGAGAGDGGAIVVGLVILVLLPVVLWVWIWLWVRLSMAAALSFAENRLRVFASWRFTKGHGFRIFLVALALFAITMAALLLMLGVGVAALAASLGVGGASTPQAFLAGISQASLMAQLVYVALVSVAFVGMTVIGAASWAEMYRQLRPSVADAFT